MLELQTDDLCEVEGRLPAATTGLALGADAGSVARTFMSGVPTLSDNAASEPGAIGASAGQCGASTLVSLPVVAEGVVVETLVLYF